MPFDTMPAGGGRESLCVLDWDTLRTMSLPLREPLLHPVLAKGDITLVRGPRGIGKSWLALTMAFAAADGWTGDSLFGWGSQVAVCPRRVLFVDTRLPLHVLQDRVARLGAWSWANRRRMDPRRRGTDGTLHLLAADAQDRRLPDLSTAEGRDEFARLAAGYDLIVFDGLAPLLRAGARRAAAWCAVVDWLFALRRQGVGILVVDGTRRFIDDIEDVAGTVLALRHPKGHDAADGVRFEVHLLKCRHGTGAAVAPFEASLDFEGGEPVWRREDVHSPTAEEVRHLYRRGLSVRAIAARLGISKSKVHRWLHVSDDEIRHVWALARQREAEQEAERNVTAQKSATSAVPTVPPAKPAPSVPDAASSAAPAKAPPATRTAAPAPTPAASDTPAPRIPPVPSVPPVPPVPNVLHFPDRPAGSALPGRDRVQESTPAPKASVPL